MKTISLTWPPALLAHAQLVRVSPAGCWEWIAGKSLGYGVVRWRGKKSYAHRVFYEALVGQIPDGKTIDHLCRNRACVNPEHMEPVSRGENVLRGEGRTAANARKTHCPMGHLLAGDNLKRGEAGTRKCRICHNARQREYERHARQM